MEENKSQPQEDEINLLEYVVAILKHKEFIIKTTLAAMFVAGVISLLVPPTYLSETKILPPQSGNSSMAASFAVQMGAMGIPATGLGMKTTNDLYIALLKTRSVVDYVIDKCAFPHQTSTGSRESVRKTLVSGLVARDDKKSGIIIVGFKHSNPQKAADIANAFVEGLQSLNNNLAVTEAGQRRLFFEDQLKSAKENLIKSEENLKSFQQRTGSLKIDDEAKAAIDTVSEMRARISSKEVQLRVMNSYATAQNPDLQRLQDEVSALKTELYKLESGSRSADNSMSTVGKISSLSTEYFRRMREFKYNEALYEILMRQYSAAKMDESRDSGVVQIIEKAEAPENRISPDRRQIVVKTGMIVFAVSILVVFLRSYYQKLVSTPETNEGIDKLRKLLDFTQLINDLRLNHVVALSKIVFGRIRQRILG